MKREGKMWSPATPSAGDVAALDEAIGLALNFKYDVAVAKLEQLLPRFEAAGDEKRAALSMFWLGFCRKKQGRTAEARELFKRVMQKYPLQEAADMAQQHLDDLPPED